MTHPNSNPAPTPDPFSPGSFSGQSPMGLPEVLQMCCLSRRSGQITFRSGESHGYVYIQHGKVLHALCGTYEGEEAIYAMLPWPGGSFTLDDDILPHKKTVTLTWEQILFEGARRADVGMLRPAPETATITTAEPLTIRIHDSRPKLTVTRPDLPPQIYEIEHEYTHVGRAANNEISLPYPSISNRHCIFIQSGPEIVVRDLNSSNGTYVNNEIISETVLRPGDLIQCGTVQMKFEPGVKRPKLTKPEMPETQDPQGALKTQGATGALYYQTMKLPSTVARANKQGKLKDDSVYVKGESAINYDDLAKPVAKKSRTGLIVTLVVIVLLAGGAGAAWYFHLIPMVH